VRLTVKRQLSELYITGRIKPLHFFVNGIPLVVIELKNPADENATINKAYDQIQTYKATIPSLFTFAGDEAPEPRP